MSAHVEINIKIKVDVDSMKTAGEIADEVQRTVRKMADEKRNIDLNIYFPFTVEIEQVH